MDFVGTKHVNETIQSAITSMNGKELECINAPTTRNKKSDRYKETSSAYNNMGEEKNSRTSEKKENQIMVMFVCMNTTKKYPIQHMNTRVQHRIHPSLI